MSVRFLASLGVLATLVLAAAAPTQPNSLPDAYLTGTVVDPLGHPIVGARLQIRHWSAHDPVAVSASVENGRFRLGPFRMNRFRMRWPGCAILARSAGYAPTIHQVDAVFPGTTLDVGTIRLEPGAKLTGTVVDAKGRPLAGARIEARPGFASVTMGGFVSVSGMGDLARRATSDAGGTFEIGPVRIGGLLLVVRADGWAATLQRRWVAPDPAYQQLGRIRLAPEAPVSGTVIDERGQPIAGARVAADLPDASHEIDASTTTDAQGRFKLSGYGENLRSITASAKGRQSHRHAFVAGKNAVTRWLSRALATKVQRTGLELVLRDAREIRGRVVEAATGRPVPIGRVRDITLCAGPRENADPAANIEVSSHASWGQDGETGAVSFTFGVGKPGDYHVHVHATGYAPTSVPVPRMKTLGAVDNLVVGLKPLAAADDPWSHRVAGAIDLHDARRRGGWVTARCVDEESRSSGSLCWVDHGCLIPLNWWGSQRTVLGPAGTFAFDHLEAGSWLLTVERPGCAPVIHGPVAVTRGKDVEDIRIEDVEGATLRGKVKRAPPASEGRVWVVAFNGNVVVRSVLADADGSFELKHLPPGDYGVSVGHDDLTAQRRAFLFRKRTYRAQSDPWRYARRVTLRPGATAELPALEHKPLR